MNDRGQSGIASTRRTGENQSVDAPKPHVLVDGHNVIHTWGWMASGESTARARLIEALRGLHDIEGVAVTIVFDGRGAAAEIDRASAQPGFAVKYAGMGLTADGEIERLAATDQTPERCVVVTRDAVVRGNVLASGGGCLSPSELQAWINRAQARTGRALRAGRIGSGGTFENKLPL